MRTLRAFGMIGFGAFAAGLCYAKIGYTASMDEWLLLLGAATLSLGGMIDLLIVAMKDCDGGIWGRPSH